MVLASKKRIVPVIMVEKAINKVQLYKPSVILARAKAPSGSARTEFVQVIFSLRQFTINYSHISLYALLLNFFRQVHISKYRFK